MPATFSAVGGGFSIRAYVGDLDVAFRATIQNLGPITGTIMAMMLLAAWAINRDITGSLGKLAAAMRPRRKSPTTSAKPR